MSLDVNTTLAHYEITEKLGQGGMGEVFRGCTSKGTVEIGSKTIA